jgi:DNA-binding MarR family transcriptional regulator
MNNTSNTSRRRLFRRLEQDLPPHVLTERDLSMLRYVRNYRFLNTAQIAALVGGSYHNVTERLSRLYHHGYLDRPTHQKDLRADGYRLMIYAIAPKGGRALAEESGEAAVVPRHLGEDNRTATRFYLAHTLMVAQFHVCLELAARQRPDLRLTQWSVPDRPLARVPIGRDLVAVVPDAYFLLENAEGNSAHFFLEADRGTMSQARFLSKLQSYWQLGTRGRPTGLPRAFRVLTITQSKQRMHNLILTAMNADPRRTGSHMFCFAAEPDYSLEDPAALFRAIWRTPADPFVFSILNHGGERNG